MRRSYILTSLVCIFLLLAISTYASPYLALHRLSSAIEAKDYDTIENHMDFASLRARVKEKMVARVIKGEFSEGSSDNPFSGLTQAMAISLINPIVDAAISPSNIVAMLNERTAMSTSGTAGSTASSQASTPAHFIFSYRNWDTIIVSQDKGNKAHFIFKRHGVWNWKLSDVDLPVDASYSRYEHY